MATDLLTISLALAVLVVPMVFAWVILSWSDRRKPKDNSPRTPTYPKYGK